MIELKVGDRVEGTDRNGDWVCGEVVDARLPKVKLVGQDGNAFAIMGACSKAAKKAGWSPEKIKSVMDKMRSGDYDNLLRVAMDHFDVS